VGGRGNMPCLICESGCVSCVCERLNVKDCIDLQRWLGWLAPVALPQARKCR
jgi:hypothetical protein